MMNTRSSNADQGQVRRILEQRAHATRKNLRDEILKNHTPDVLIHDVLPPMKYEGGRLCALFHSMPRDSDRAAGNERCAAASVVSKLTTRHAAPAGQTPAGAISSRDLLVRVCRARTAMAKGRIRLAVRQARP